MDDSTPPHLRPLGTGEILDAGIRLVRARFGTLVVCALVVAVPLAILDTLVLAATNDRAFDFSTGATTTTAGSDAAAGALVARLLGILLVVLVLAACFRAVSAAYMGQRATAGDSLRFALERLPALLGAYFLVLVSVLIGTLALVIPGIYLAVRLSVTFPALLFERIGPVEAYTRSLALVGGHWWRTFGIFLVTGVALVVLSLALGAGVAALIGHAAPDSQTTGAVVATIVNIVFDVIVYPIAAAILTVLYYDLRVRSEGVDAVRPADGAGREDAPAPPRLHRGFAPPQAPDGPPARAPETPGGPPDREDG